MEGEGEGRVRDGEGREGGRELTSEGRKSSEACLIIVKRS